MSRRLWSTEPYVLPFSRMTGIAACVLIGLLCALAVGGFLLVRKPTAKEGPFDPHCGVFPKQERELLFSFTGQSLTNDVALGKKLTELETGAESDASTKAAARRIRLQCGLITDGTEYWEASAFQLTTRGIVLDAGTSPPLTSAIADASARWSPDLLSKGGRFEVAELLRSELSLPKKDPPSEFDQARDVVQQIYAQINDFVTLYAL